MTKRYVTPAEIRFLRAIADNNGDCYRPALQLCWYAGAFVAREQIAAPCVRKNFLQLLSVSAKGDALYIMTGLGYVVLETELDELNATP